MYLVDHKLVSSSLLKLEDYYSKGLIDNRYRNWKEESYSEGYKWDEIE